MAQTCIKSTLACFHLLIVLHCFIGHEECCPDDWVAVRRGCCKLHREQIPYGEASATCENEGSALPSSWWTVREYLAELFPLKEQDISDSFWLYTRTYEENHRIYTRNGNCNSYTNEGFVIQSCNMTASFICKKSNVFYCPQVSAPDHNDSMCFWNADRTADSKEKAVSVCTKNNGVLIDIGSISGESVRNFHDNNLLTSHGSHLLVFWLDFTWNDENITVPSDKTVNLPPISSFRRGRRSCATVKFEESDFSKYDIRQSKCNALAEVICKIYYKDGTQPYLTTPVTPLTLTMPVTPLTLTTSVTLTTPTTPLTPEYTRKMPRRFPISSLQCPHGYNWKEDKRTEQCYWETSYETSRLPWEEARKYCQSYRGDLASFHSKNEEMIGLSFQYGSLVHNYWIGLVLDVDTDAYVWTDGTPLNYTNWAPGQPDHRNRRMRCVQMHAAEKHWIVSYCGLFSWFVCKSPKQLNPRAPAVPTREPLQSCPDMDDVGEGEENSYLFDGYCYSHVQIQYSWHRAQEYCGHNSGNLVSVHGEKEVDFLIRMLYAENILSGNRVWIGLNAMGRDGQYKWSDNTQLDFVNWNYDEPNNVMKQEKCCNMYVGNALWNDENCNNVMTFVCKRRYGPTKEPPTTTATMALVEGNCKEGWYPFENQCYLPVGINKKDWKSWVEASNHCYNIGSHLTSIHSERQQAFLSFLLQTLKKDAWIGLHDTIRSGIFFWFDNTPVDYTDWLPGEPSALSWRTDCVSMTYNHTKSGVWDDITCDQQLPFICETSKDPALPKQPRLENLQCIHPQEWLKMDKSCFMFFNEKATWEKAKSTCEMQHGQLVSISDFTVQATVKYLASHTNESFWIGLTANDNYEFQWMNGWPVKLTEWDKNQPDLSISHGRSCFSSSREGYWKVASRNDLKYFICQITAGQPPKIERNTTPCPDGYQDISGEKCVQFQRDNRASFNAGGFACFLKGNNFASIHSLEQMQKLKNFAPNDSFYVGLTRNQRGGFEWNDLSPVDFVYWDQGQPENERDQCVSAVKNTYRWQVVPCATRLYSVCSKSRVNSIEENSNTSSSRFTQHQKGIYTGLSAGAIAAIILTLLIALALTIGAVIFLYVRSSGKFPFRIFSSREHITSFENALFNPDSGIEMYNNKNSFPANEE